MLQENNDKVLLLVSCLLQALIVMILHACLSDVSLMNFGFLIIFQVGCSYIFLETFLSRGPLNLSSFPLYLLISGVLIFVSFQWIFSRHRCVFTILKFLNLSSFLSTIFSSFFLQTTFQLVHFLKASSRGQNFISIK